MKRLISSALTLVMCFCMAFGVLPTNSFADEEGTDNCPVVEVENTGFSKHNGKVDKSSNKGDDNPDPGKNGEAYSQDK